MNCGLKSETSARLATREGTACDARTWARVVPSHRPHRCDGPAPLRASLPSSPGLGAAALRSPAHLERLQHEVEHTVGIEVEVADETLEVLDDLGGRLTSARRCRATRRRQLRQLSDQLRVALRLLTEQIVLELRVEHARVEPHLPLVEVGMVLDDASLLQHIPQLQPCAQKLVAHHLLLPRSLDQSCEELLRVELAVGVELEAEEPEDVGEVGLNERTHRHWNVLLRGQKIHQVAGRQVLAHDCTAELVEHHLERVRSGLCRQRLGRRGALAQRRSPASIRKGVAALARSYFRWRLCTPHAGSADRKGLRVPWPKLHSRFRRTTFGPLLAEAHDHAGFQRFDARHPRTSPCRRRSARTVAAER